MKKAIAGILVASLILSLVLAGCGKTPEGEVHHKSVWFDGNGSWTEEETAAFLKERLRPASENLIRYIYAEEELREDISPSRDLLAWTGDSPRNAPWVLGYYPVDNVRWVETAGGGHYYAVWMTDGGHYCYAFFTPEGMGYGHPVYVSGKARNWRDFASLKVGDRLEKVIRIDPSAGIYADSFRALREGESAEEGNRDVRERYEIYGNWSLTSVHLLRDGFLEIRYLFGRNGGYLIDRIEYSPDFKGICSMAELSAEWQDMTEEDRELNRQNNEMWKAQYDFSILEKDYCPAETVEPAEDAEQNELPPAEEASWSLKVTAGEGEKARETVLRPGDIGKDEIWTIVTWRFRGNDPAGSAENLYVSGIPLTLLADRAEAGEWQWARVRLPDGSEKTFSREYAEEKVLLAAWLRSGSSLLDGSETGIALAGRDMEPEYYLPSITGVTFLP